MKDNHEAVLSTAKGKDYMIIIIMGQHGPPTGLPTQKHACKVNCKL